MTFDPTDPMSWSKEELLAEEMAADLAAERRLEAIAAENGDVFDEAADRAEQAWQYDQAQSLTEALLADAPDLPADPSQWEITDDGKATWALRKLAAAKAELDRLRANATAETQRIKLWLEDAERGPAHDAAFFEGKLLSYYRRLEVANKNHPKTYKLPAGSIAKTKGSVSTKVTDPAAFLAWAEVNCPEAVKREPLVSKLSDFERDGDDGTGELVIAGTGRVDEETGEIVEVETVPGVESVRGEPTYKVTPSVDVEPF